MKLKLKDGVGAYANGELTYVSDDQPFDVDKRFAEESLLPTGYFEVAKEATEASEIVASASEVVEVDEQEAVEIDETEPAGDILQPEPVAEAGPAPAQPVRNARKSKEK